MERRCKRVMETNGIFFRGIFFERSIGGFRFDTSRKAACLL